MNKSKTGVLILIILALSVITSFSSDKLNQSINPELLKDWWSAKWVCYPGAPSNDYGVYNFRKTFELQNIPDSFIIHISADNRYKLYCNGKEVSAGPEVSNPDNWKFTTLNISGYLQRGNNTLAAVVWNFGTLSPYFQMTARTGFLVQGNSETEEIVNTDNTWKSYHNKSYRGIPIDRKEIPFFCV
ncbi:hypothetical protein KAS50_06775, partial [bacterium]|nr:hypothetical protein [bacterium]